MTKKDASKAEFVRGLPQDMPAKEVVEKAKDAGLKLTTAYVYVIRSQARTAGAPKKTSPSAATPRATKNEPMEAKLIAAASEIGLTRAIDLLTREKERVMRLLR